ncbi:MAG: hypothetical protein GWP08_10505 [Nitrospiraceae bacterium]|nr:hypothetical protein [Nitrospiraceae bacterium]
MSNIAGQDPHAHGDDPKTAVAEVRSWLATASLRKGIPGGAAIWEHYVRFLGDLPAIFKRESLEESEVKFVDYTHIVSDWLEANA